MPIDYLRGLTGRSRTHLADRHLAYYLTFTAGAVNAGGFLAIGHFTSHMSGIVSLMAEHTAVGELRTAAGGALAVFLFTSGAAVSAWLVSWGRRQDRESMYALPLLLEGVLLLVFGLWGGTLADRPAIFVPLTIGLLCFLMGLQNAMVTKLSQAEIRTTHVTGMITDVGIEIGKLVRTGTGVRSSIRAGGSAPIATGCAGCRSWSRPSSSAASPAPSGSGISASSPRCRWPCSSSCSRVSRCWTTCGDGPDRRSRFYEHAAARPRQTARGRSTRPRAPRRC